MKNVSFRFATKDDCELVLQFIKDLAKYEKLENEVVATKELLDKWLFDEKKAEVLFISENDEVAGFALFFTTFSTFWARPGIHLEDLYVSPKFRGLGYGKKILQELSKITVQRGYGRLEWWCLNWNQPSIDFYKSLGAQTMDEWTDYRLSGRALTDLSNK